MIEKIIYSYLYDEDAWNAYGKDLHTKNFAKAKPLLNEDFVKPFMQFHEFHDWTLESFRMEYQSNELAVTFQLRDDLNAMYDLHIGQCSGCRVVGADIAKIQHSNQIQIISFEKKAELCIGIALSNGTVIYVFCQIPIIFLKRITDIVN